MACISQGSKVQKVRESMVSPIHVHLSEGKNWDEKSVEAMIQKSEQYIEEAETPLSVAALL
jgi:hypothetical protein